MNAPRSTPSRSPRRPRRLTAALCTSALLLAASANAASVEDASPKPSGEGVPADPGQALTGHEIYEKVLDNRFDSYVQQISMHSGDRGGNVQNTEMEIKYRDFRAEQDRILSKVIMKYHAPQDVRHLGYLVINKDDGSEDQFVYRPSSRRVQRINLRGEAIFGTDFAFEDIIPQEVEDATYERLPDSEFEGFPVYVVAVTPKPEQDSEYSKFDVYVTRDQFVALRVHYWDKDGLKIKELSAKPESVTMYEHEEKGELKQIWVARQQKIVHLKLDSWTELEIEKLDPTVDLKSRHFSERELTSSH
jgi:hypothetical protein